MGVKALAQLWQRLFLQGIGQDLQHRITDQCHVGQQPGVARARAVFAHQGVAPPVVAHFHPTPVASDQVQPLPWGVLLGQRARQVVTRFGGGVAGLFHRPLAAQDDQRSSVGKVCGERFDGEGVQTPGLHASVPGLGVGKKGVPFNASSPWACWSSLGWLPLIWNR